MASDNHASYAKIGFMVFIGVGAIVAALIYLGGVRGRSDELLVETVYDKPVAGLSVGSAVNFRGVHVGEVREIDFVGNKYHVEGADNSRIYILMAMDSRRLGIPGTTDEALISGVKATVERLGLRATVASSGITGLSRIECDFTFGEARTEPPKITWTPRHAYIPAKISLLDNFSVAATKVMNQINRMDLSTAWSNVNSSVESMARAMNSAQQALNSAQTMIETRQSDLDRMMDDLSETASSVRALAAELKRNPSLLIRERTPERLEETE